MHVRHEPGRGVVIRSAGLAVLLASLVHCGGSSPQRIQSRESYPVVAFQTDDPARVQTVGSPWTRWLEIDGEDRPTLFGREDFQVWIRRDRLGGATVRGRYGLSGRLLQQGAQATFRVSVAGEPGVEATVLFEDTVADTKRHWRSFSLTIPAGWEEGYIGFRVSHRGKEAGEPPFGTWVDPWIETDVEIDGFQARPRGDVLVITADTTRMDDLGSYGGAASTPALVRLRNDGVQLQNAFSVALGTTPSHSSLFTASHAAAHGVYNNRTALGADRTTLAEVLRGRGYRTGAFVSAVPVARLVGLDQGFEVFDDVLIFDGDSGLGRYSRFERRAERTVSRFLDWLDVPDQRPFFAWVHLFDPHQPYSPPVSPAGEADVERSFFIGDDGEPAYVHIEDLSDLEVDTLRSVDAAARARYRAEIEYLDSQLGRIVDALEAHGRYDDLLVVFVSDHGEIFLPDSPMLAFGHSALIDAVTRLPLLLKLPGSALAGQKPEFLLGSLDIAPTVLEILDIDAPEDWEGRSFESSLRGAPDEFRDWVLLEGAHEQEIAVRTRDWSCRQVLAERRGEHHVLASLGYRPGAPQEFELVASGAGDADAEGERARCASIIEGFLATKGERRGETILGEEHREALEALGY
jgi:arylsulfatase A-like enzyme